jgi:Protein of unknown function (DUF4038)/Putative collagen-binding domain of a collagenase
MAIRTIRRSFGRPADIFPLYNSSGERFLRRADGKPFLIVGDSPWSAEVQLTRSQIDTYTADRADRGFSAIMFEAMERLFSSQTPAYNNANGDQPFTTMSPISWTSRVSAYWNHVDYLVNSAKTRNLACFIAPAYAGFNGGSEGWQSEIDAASAGDLQDYGAFLASRYIQNNVVWVMGGDFAGSTTQRDKQWNIATGIRSVTPNAFICGHPSRDDSDGYTYWGAGGQNYTGWNINTVYSDKTGVVSESATAYGRSGPIPAIGIEFAYEGGGAAPTTSEVAHMASQCYLSGLCGHFFGNNPLWGFGEPNANGGAGVASALSTSLNTAGARAVVNLGSLLRARQWWLLVPKTDTSVVTGSLGSGATAICPARASDGTFALIGKNDAASMTIAKTCMRPTPFYARWFDPTNNTFTTPAEGLSHANTGTQAFAHPGNNSVGGTAWILVLE